VPDEPIGYLIETDSHLIMTANMPSVPDPGRDSTQSLAALHKGDQGVVVGVRDDGAALGDETGGTIVMRLIELGFVAGERVEVIAESLPGGDPISVRVGGSCFALRRREAAAVMIAVART
jgi:ferrous iron transport protein A